MNPHHIMAFVATPLVILILWQTYRLFECEEFKWSDLIPAGLGLLLWAAVRAGLFL